MALCCNYCSAIVLVGFSFGSNSTTDDSAGGAGLMDFSEASRVVESVLHAMVALKISGTPADSIEEEDSLASAAQGMLNDSAQSRKRAKKTSQGACGKTGMMTRPEIHGVPHAEGAAIGFPLCRAAVVVWRNMSSQHQDLMSGSICQDDERPTFISGGKGVLLSGFEVCTACRKTGDEGWCVRGSA